MIAASDERRSDSDGLRSPGPPAGSSTAVRVPQPLRFLIVGGLNTLWGYGCFAALYYLLSAHVHYVVILTVANVINITFSFTTYKSLVFQTRGQCFREYLRFYAVNTVPIALGYILFPVLKDLCQVNAYLAQAIILGITIVVSYFGHKHISFARKENRPAEVRS